MDPGQCLQNSRGAGDPDPRIEVDLRLRLRFHSLPVSLCYFIYLEDIKPKHHTT